MVKDIITIGDVNRGSEELFIELFCDVFGPENSVARAFIIIIVALRGI